MKIENDPCLKTGTGVLESSMNFTEAVEFLANPPDYLRGPNGEGPKLSVEVIKNSKNHNGANFLCISDGDVTIEISKHGVFAYAWSGAS